jgi:hypothetical protein
VADELDDMAGSPDLLKNDLDSDTVDILCGRIVEPFVARTRYPEDHLSVQVSNRHRRLMRQAMVCWQAEVERFFANWASPEVGISYGKYADASVQPSPQNPFNHLDGGCAFEYHRRRLRLRRPQSAKNWEESTVNISGVSQPDWPVFEQRLVPGQFPGALRVGERGIRLGDKQPARFG